jgi:hypothetical protein
MPCVQPQVDESAGAWGARRSREALPFAAETSRDRWGVSRCQGERGLGGVGQDEGKGAVGGW